MRVIIPLLCFCVLRVACAQPGAAGLKRQLEEIASSAGGRTGISAIHIESGEHIAVRGDQPYFMASVLKFPVALRVLELVDQRKLTLDRKVRVRPADFRPGNSPIRDKYPRGVTLSIRQLLEYMLTASDNTAGDLLLKFSGGPAAVTRRLQALGIVGIILDRDEGQMARLYALDPKAFLSTTHDTSTPDAMTALLVKFAKAQTLQPASTAVVRDFMTKSATGAARLRGLLPAGTVVTDKTGTWGDRGGANAATNDVGIITLPGDAGQIAVAVFNAGSKRPLAERERAIAQIGRALYDHWSRPSSPPAAGVSH